MKQMKKSILGMVLALALLVTAALPAAAQTDGAAKVSGQELSEALFGALDWAKKGEDVLLNDAFLETAGIGGEWLVLAASRAADTHHGGSRLFIGGADVGLRRFVDVNGLIVVGVQGAGIPLRGGRGCVVLQAAAQDHHGRRGNDAADKGRTEGHGDHRGKAVGALVFLILCFRLLRRSHRGRGRSLLGKPRHAGFAGGAGIYFGMPLPDPNKRDA